MHLNGGELATVSSQMPQLQPSFSEASCAALAVLLLFFTCFVVCLLCYLTLHIKEHLLVPLILWLPQATNVPRTCMLDRFCLEGVSAY